MAVSSFDGGVEITGIDEVKWVLANLDKKISKKYMVSVFRAESKPLIAAARSGAPVSQKKAWISAHRHVSKKQFTTKNVTHKPGDLKRSIRVFVGKSKQGTIWIGPQAGSGKNPDAYYAKFVEFGSVRGGKKSKEQPFMKNAWEQTKDQVIAGIANRLKVDIKQYVSSKLK